MTCFSLLYAHPRLLSSGCEEYYDLKIFEITPVAFKLHKFYFFFIYLMKLGCFQWLGCYIGNYVIKQSKYIKLEWGLHYIFECIKNVFLHTNICLNFIFGQLGAVGISLYYQG